MREESIDNSEAYVPPASLRCNIWSVMSDIRGDITSVHPAARRAGSWYVRDFPPPVGMTQTISRPSMFALQTLFEQSYI